eukprot:gene1903-2587_t
MKAYIYGRHSESNEFSVLTRADVAEALPALSLTASNAFRGAAISDVPQTWRVLRIAFAVAAAIIINGAMHGHTLAETASFLPKLSLDSILNPDPTIAKVACNASAKLMVVSVIGAYLTKIGFFDENMQKSLSLLIFNLFLPAIIFNNVLKTSMSGAIATLWILPLFAILQVGVGYLLGFMARALSGQKGVEGKAVVASVAHCNGSNLALVFVDAVARSHPVLVAAAGRLLIPSES